MKRIVITENMLREILKENHIPDYFKPQVKNGKVTLYHGLSNKSLEYVLSFDELTPKTCSEGCFGLWFSIKGKDDYPSGNECMISIDVPLEDIGSGRRFRVMNEIHVLTDKPISINEYDFKVLKIGGFNIDDEMLSHWREMLDKEPQVITKFLEELCYGSAIYYYLMDKLNEMD